MRDERDLQLSKVQTLTSELDKSRESTEKSCIEFNKLTIKTTELEVGLIPFLSDEHASSCLFSFMT